MNHESDQPASKVQSLEINEDNHDQRLDNFLITRLKGVPKSFIYRIVRKGEVRVNKGRVDVSYRLNTGDVVRIPPVRLAENATRNPVVGRESALQIKDAILFEDDALLILNKPAGMAVHGGSGIQAGLIESLRVLYPDHQFLELVHRLDRDTSGCLMVAKKRSALRVLHEQFRSDAIRKNYLALLAGRWAGKKTVVNQPLLKNVSKGGERMVVISPSGKASETRFQRQQLYADATLVEASPVTGRTHQIRVHAAYLNHPIIGDQRYGIDEINKTFRHRGYKQLFLHAQHLQFQHPTSGKTLKITAPLSEHFSLFLANEKPI
jgi:23S rRNA pseudouridine955/2504/2580 synthase